MKLKQTLLLSSLLLLIFFSSCNCDDDNTNSKQDTNIISINGNTFNANYALKEVFSHHYEIVVSTENISTKNFTGTISFFGVLISSDDGVIIPGTYTFSLDSASDYDPSIHFFDGEAGENIIMTNGEADTDGKNFYDKINDGKVKIEQTGSEYKITFDVNFVGASVTGYYEGKIE